MKVAPKRKKWKILLIILGIFASLIFAFHLWFVHHAESLIEDMVRRQSNGKVDLRVRNFKFNWFSKKMEMEQAVFFTTDSTAPASYLFAVRRIKIQVQSVWPLVLEKKFLIDSLQLIDPDISVTRRRQVTSEQNTADSSLSIPQEMGRISFYSGCVASAGSYPLSNYQRQLLPVQSHTPAGCTGTYYPSQPAPR